MDSKTVSELAYKSPVYPFAPLDNLLAATCLQIVAEAALGRHELRIQWYDPDLDPWCVTRNAVIDHCRAKGFVCTWNGYSILIQWPGSPDPA